MPALTKCYFEPADLLAAALEVREKRSALCKYLIQPWTPEFDPSVYDLLGSFDRIVLLHRDPRDFMVSAFLYSFFESHTADSLSGMSQVLRLLERKEQDPLAIGFARMITLKNCLERGDHISLELEHTQLVVDRFGNELDLRVHPLVAAETSAEQRVADLLEHDAKARGFLNYVLRSCQAMVEIKRYFDGCGRDVCWLSYENLVSGRLTAVAQYLGLPLAADTEVAKQHQRVARTKGSGDWKNWLTPADIPLLKPKFTEYLAEFGYPNDWQLPENPQINPRHGSDYVYRLFHERQLSRPTIAVEFDRETLEGIGSALESTVPQDARLVSGLIPKRTQVIGTGDVLIENAHFESVTGEAVNVLVAGQSYRFVYRVRFKRPFLGVSFWMQLCNQNGPPVFHGTSFDGNATLAAVEANSAYAVSFPFPCDLRRGLYYCNAGVTHAPAGKSQILHRRVPAAAILVRKIVPREWAQPRIERLEQRPAPR